MSNARLDLLQVTLHLMVSQTLNVLGPLHGNEDGTPWERPAAMMGSVLAASGEGGWVWAS